MIRIFFGVIIALFVVTAASASLRSEEIPSGWVTELHASTPEPKKKSLNVKLPRVTSRVETGSADKGPLEKVPPEKKNTGNLANKAHALDGIASYYWQDLYTASGEIFDKKAMTAAHPTLPFGTVVEVTNLGNGRSAVVRINDRGPFIAGRVIDVSEAAADVLGMRLTGLAPVRINIMTASADEKIEKELDSHALPSETK